MSDTREKLNIGLYGGSFDPVHAGHMRVARAFLRQQKPEKLIVMPCRVPPHKEKTAGAGGEARLRMLRAAFAGDERIEVSDYELKKDGVSYTVETLRELGERYPDRNILLVVGADMFLTLRDWKGSDEIFSRCTPCVYTRGDTAEALREYAAGLKRDFGVETRFIKGRLSDLSSTALREALAQDKRVGSAVPKSVRRIIEATGVYRSENYRLEVYRRESERLVEDKRYRHILRVEQAAIALAERYGADVFKARAAALLHDVTKRKTDEEQLAMALEFGLIGAEEFKKSPKVAHAFTGAAYAEHRLFVSDPEILDAIRYHTTGRAGMGLLEKIIFLADGIEDGRTFDGVEKLREVAFKDLDMAMLISLELTKEKVDKRGAYLHPLTADAIEYYREAVK